MSFQKTLKCVERKTGKNTDQCACLLQQIGAEYSNLGQLDEALSYHQLARVGYEKVKLINTANFGLLMQNTGIIHELKCNLSEALKHYTRAEAILRKAAPPDHPHITECMRRIAAVIAKLGNDEAAAAAAATAASAARRSQVQCAAAGCPRKVQADGSPLDQCGGCKRCYYCSKACQTADWKAGHKMECKEQRGRK